MIPSLRPLQHDPWYLWTVQSSCLLPLWMPVLLCTAHLYPFALFSYISFFTMSAERTYISHSQQEAGCAQRMCALSGNSPHHDSTIGLLYCPTSADVLELLGSGGSPVFFFWVFIEHLPFLPPSSWFLDTVLNMPISVSPQHYHITNTLMTMTLLQTTLQI